MVKMSEHYSCLSAEFDLRLEHHSSSGHEQKVQVSLAFPPELKELTFTNSIITLQAVFLSLLQQSDFDLGNFSLKSLLFQNTLAPLRECVFPQNS